jgi:hypothetical protein
MQLIDFNKLNHAQLYLMYKDQEASNLMFILPNICFMTHIPF